jgi:hypothetical protein
MQVDAVIIKWSEVKPNRWDSTLYIPELNANNEIHENRAAIQKAEVELPNKKDSYTGKKVFYIKWSEVKNRLDVSCCDG